MVDPAAIQVITALPLPAELRSWEFIGDCFKLMDPRIPAVQVQPILNRLRALKVILFRSSWETGGGVFLGEEAELPKSLTMLVNEHSILKDYTGRLTFNPETPGTVYRSQAMVDRHSSNGGWRIARRIATTPAELKNLRKLMEARGDDFHWIQWNDEVNIQFIDSARIVMTK